MSQRLTDPYVTDETGKAMWLSQCGQLFPFLAGAEDDPDDDNPDTSTSGAENTDDDDEDENDSDKTDDDKDDPKKLRERMSAADRRASKLQKERDDLLAEKKKQDDAKKTDLERAENRVKELETETAKKDEAINELRVQVAFFSVGGKDMPVWIDPADALSSLDLSEVEISDEGVIDKKSLRKAIKTLAAEKPHWVKKDDDDKENDSSTEASGSQMNGKRKGKGDAPDAAALSKDFPALRTRQV
jgi:hypothetical protein